MHQRRCTACLAALLALLAGCAGPQPWWQQDLQDWQGAPVSELLEAWGAPLRTLTDENDAATLVYERSRELDLRLDALADPAAQLDPGGTRDVHAARNRSECTVYFEILGERVAEVRHEGGACDVVPRDPARRRIDPAVR